ncbi:MAG: glycosyltransferase family 4 protein [Roseobacter sp.]
MTHDQTHHDPISRPRILLIAEAANPEWVSVPLVGWSLAHALREVADVHLVTQIRNKEAILRAGYTEGTDFTAIDSEAISKPMHKLAQVLRMGSGKGWTMNTAIAVLSYPYFERLVWQRFGSDIKAGHYDIVHRVTPLTPTTVSPIAAKCAAAGVPFMVGPLNGGVPWPKGFDTERRREREWLSYVRDAYKLMPGRSRMLKSTAAFLAGSRHTASEIPEDLQDRVYYCPENAIDTTRFSRIAEQHTEGPLRAVFIGRLVPYKGLDMGIEAARPHLESGAMRLDVIGDGPMRGALEAMVQDAGLGDAVTFHGQMAHETVQDIAVQSNILLFPSIREFGGGVVLEAMSLGVVPVIVDYAGPGELVTPETGFAVPIGSRDEIIVALRHALDGILENRDTLPSMAKHAQTRVFDDFTWPAKARKIVEIYTKVLANRST